MNFLDSTGLSRYTTKIKSLLSGYVPTTRTVNGKALSSNITLTAANVSAVPTTRTVNGKALSSNITLTTSDIDMSLYAPKESPVFSGTISKGRKSESTVGSSSVVFGYQCEASKLYSYAEGYAVISSATASHAEGRGTSASAQAAHAEGYHTTASNFASHASGKFSKAMTDGALLSNKVGDVFVVGNGTAEDSLSNALRLAYEGTLYLTKAYNSTGADYAEYFEWLDGNPDGEDRVGHFVTLKGDKLVYAQPGDYVLGVVSGQPCIIGNADEDWLGRWVHDDFNRFVKEYLVMHEVEVTPPEDITEDKLQLWLLDNDIQEREGKYFKMEEEIVDYPTPHWRHKANPSYDATQAYIERKDRKEWDAVGMVGVLSVVDDGSCVVNGYATVAEDGIATVVEGEGSKHYRVIQRVSDNIIKIVFSV